VGACDVAESCTGTAAACPADAFAPSATVCRNSAGACDVAESCTGTAAACPADGFASTATVCRSSAGPCDLAESCTGAAAACPADGFKLAGTSCGSPSDTACDNPDTCNGSGACQANNEANGFDCTSDGNDCTDDICNAGTCTHPNDDTNPCMEDGNLCTRDECAAGVCTHPNRPSGFACGRSSDTVCDNSDTCDGAGTCRENNESDGTTCNADNLACTSDTCQIGQCVAGTPPFQKMHGSGEIGTKPNQAHFGFNVKSPQPKGELNYRRKNAKIHGKVINVFYACDGSTTFRVETKNYCQYDVTVIGNPEGRTNNIEFFGIDYVAGTGSGCADEHNAGSCEKGRIKSSNNKDEDDDDEDH
jgi:hypothetical protein